MIFWLAVKFHFSPTGFTVSKCYFGHHDQIDETKAFTRSAGIISGTAGVQQWTVPVNLP